MQSGARLLAAAVVSMTVFATAADAQNTLPAPSASVSGGAFFYDLPPAIGQTGSAPMLAVRGTRRLSRVALIEGGVLAAFADADLGARTTFVLPEAQLQFQHPFRGVVPYFGFGGGLLARIADERLGGTTYDMTMSAALGVRVVLGERVGIKADARLRGIGAGFDGAASELSAGLLWRLGR